MDQKRAEEFANALKAAQQESQECERSAVDPVIALADKCINSAKDPATIQNEAAQRLLQEQRKAKIKQVLEGFPSVEEAFAGTESRVDNTLANGEAPHPADHNALLELAIECRAQSRTLKSLGQNK